MGASKMDVRRGDMLELVMAADSVSSLSSSFTESETSLSPPDQSRGRLLLAAVRGGLSRSAKMLSPASLVTSGLAPTSELQEAVLEAYREVVRGSKQRFGALYQLGEMLGQGHYARVHLATSLHGGATYAVKILPKAIKKSVARTQLQGLVKEVAIMRLLQGHPSAVQLHQVLQDKDNYYLMMEHCDGGELFDKLYKVDHLPEAEAAHYMAQLASFLAYAHDRHIIHRDIKPENMMLTSVPGGDPQGLSGWRLKVLDYGCSSFCLPGQKLDEVLGTVRYVAPEVLHQSYDKQADVWSAGVVMYTLLCGHLPMDASTDEETLLLVRAGVYDMSPKYWHHVSAAGQALVQKLLSYDPSRRLTASQLLQDNWVMQHLQASWGTEKKKTAGIPAGIAVGTTAGVLA